MIKAIFGLLILVIILGFTIYSTVVGFGMIVFGDWTGIYPLLVGLWLFQKFWELR
jgi:hypothetical protein